MWFHKWSLMSKYRQYLFKCKRNNKKSVNRTTFCSCYKKYWEEYAMSLVSTDPRRVCPIEDNKDLFNYSWNYYIKKKKW